MLGTELVWYPESQSGICVYTTNNDFYICSVQTDLQWKFC